MKFDVSGLVAWIFAARDNAQLEGHESFNDGVMCMADKILAQIYSMMAKEIMGEG